MASAPPPPSYNEAIREPNQPGFNPAHSEPLPDYPGTGYAPNQTYSGTGYMPPQNQAYGFSNYPPTSTPAYPPPKFVGVANPGYNPDYVQPAGRTPSGAAQQDGRHHLGPAPAPEDAEQGVGEWRSFSDKAIRRAFIRKVYLILFSQLAVTFGCICFFIFHTPTRMWVRENQWFYWVSYGVFLITYIVLACCPSVRRKYPGNFICLGIFTLAFSYMTATISSFYSTNIVLIAIGITCVVCLSITIFAIQTKIDFTMCSGLIFALFMVLILFGFSCMIVYLVWGPNYILQCVYGALAALVFSLFLAYDTQMLVGGHKYRLSEEEYIFGALQLYMDVVLLFLIILSLFGGSNR